jgi:hypothetical protein
VRLDRRTALVAGGALLGAVAVGGLLVVAFSGEEEAAEAPPGTTAPETTTTTTVRLPVFPLTGLAAEGADISGNHPAVVVKIDDGIQSRPQTGLNQADVVFEEEVEGVTRLAAVFHSTLPETVGNVRSARSSDIDILSQLSVPLFAWSGGNAGVTREVLNAASAGLLTNASGDVATPAYFRSSDRKQPYNLYVHPSQLLELRAPEGQGAPAPIFTFRSEGQAVAPGSLPALGVSIPFTRAARISYLWDAERQGWDRFQVDSEHGLADSAFVDSEGVQVSPANVVVMSTPYGTSPSDRRSPMALTVGEGDVLVFTNGAVVVGRWVRPDATRPAQLLAADGTPIALTPGRTWIELPRTGVELAFIDQATADALAVARR